MILVIRISGMVKVPKKVEETLYRMNLRRKYSATIIKDNIENRKLLESVRNFVAYGVISKDVVKKLIEMRGQNYDNKKIEINSLIEKIETSGLKNSGLKPFFRLHPPRKGIDSKLHFGVRKGVLGDNGDKIKELVERML